MPDNPLYRHPSMQILRAAIARENRLQLIAVLALFVSGLVIGYFALGRSSFIAALGITAAAIGARLVYQSIHQQNVEENELIHLLFQEPEKIVWVYGVVTEHHPFGFKTTQGGVLYFYLVDGNSHSVGLSAKRLKQVSKFLNRLLPRAVFGYTEERAQAYARDPRSLK